MKQIVTFFLFISTQLTLFANSHRPNDSMELGKFYFSINPNLNFILPENSYFVNHKPQLSKLSSNYEFGYSFLKYSAFVNYYNRHIGYCSYSRHSNDLLSNSEYKYNISGFGIFAQHTLFQKGHIQLYHGYGIGINKIRMATLTIINTDTKLHISDTVQNINVLTVQKSVQRVSLSINLRTFYTFPKLHHFGIFADYSITKNLKNKNNANIDILTYYGGYVSSFSLGVKYELF